MSNSNSSLATSIVLAAYNGEAYLAHQLDSIASQMKAQDQLILSIDPSTDHTVKIATDFQLAHPQLDIRILQGPGNGLIANFEHGLKQAERDIVLLADQDDEWMPNKLKVVCQQFEQDCALMGLVHDAAICDGHLEVLEPSFFKAHASKNGYKQNILRNSFIGCCMALRKEVVDVALPFVSPLPMHDQYLGLIALKMGKVEFLEHPLVKYRRHENNVSSLHHASLSNQIAWRFQILKAMRQIDWRLKKRKEKGAKA